MSDLSLDELGPVDFAVVEFPAGASSFTGEMTTELLALVDAGTIRIIDALVLTMESDGTIDAMELINTGALGELSRVEAELADLRPRKTSTSLPQPWTRAARPASWCGRTCGPRPSRPQPASPEAS